MLDKFTRAYIGLGSNLDDPPAQLQQALRALAELPNTQLSRVSSFYRSVPVGPAAQPDYCNAVAALDTELSPLELLDALQAIEERQGRVRNEHWGPRTLDLDILLFGNQCIHLRRLFVPHPCIRERAFVLYPLAEIDESPAIPGGERFADWLAACPFEGIEKLSFPAPLLGEATQPTLEHL